jgi:hypothetical protein
MKQFLLILIFSLSAFACSTAKVRILPGESSNRVVVTDFERDDAEEAASRAASDYCERRGRELMYIGNQTNYTGDMDESTRKIVRNGSKAAMLLGGTGSAFRGHTQGPAELLGTAGTVGYVMTSNRDYQTSMEFKCR